MHTCTHTYTGTYVHTHTHTPVKISPCQRAAIVADDHPIWVQHGDYLEHKHLPEQLGIRVSAGEEVEEALHHPAGVGLPGVDTGSDHNRLLGLCAGRGCERRGVA